MATYSSYEQMKQTLIQKGYPPQQAEKLASQKFIRKTGERPSKLKKAAKTPPPYDPSKKKKKQLNSSIDIVQSVLTEIYGVTGLIGAPPASSLPSMTMPGSTGKASYSPNNTPSKEKGETKELGGSSKKGSTGFSSKGIQKVKVEKAAPGQVTKRPEGLSDSINIIAKQIEEEFGIK